MATNKLATDFCDDKPTSGYQLQWNLELVASTMYFLEMPLNWMSHIVIAAEIMLPLVNELDDELLLARIDGWIWKLKQMASMRTRVPRARVLLYNATLRIPLEIPSSVTLTILFNQLSQIILQPSLRSGFHLFEYLFLTETFLRINFSESSLRSLRRAWSKV